MSYLADTHLLVWAAQSPERLPEPVEALFASLSAEIRFSVISVWEVAIKKQKRPEEFTFEADMFRNGLLERGFVEIPVTGEHVLAAEALPMIHRDRFDRMLIAQAAVEELRLLTCDETIVRYPGPIWRV